MTLPRNTLRWTALGGLWIMVGLICWVLLVEGMMALFSPLGAWRMPGIAKVNVSKIERDDTGKLTGYVLAVREGQTKALRMSKEEAAELEPEVEVWILDNYFVNGPRPDHFRLTPLRFLLEYPEPLLLILLWAIWLIRRTQIEEAKEDPNRVRTIWRDEYYTKADAFGPPKGPEGKT